VETVVGKITVRPSLEEYRRQAATGDPGAIFDLAWQYFRERKGAEDVRMAITTFRQLEEKHPEWAHFNIAKMKIIAGDASFKEDIQADCDAGFGPSCYLLGLFYRKQQGGTNEAISYFRAGAESGHLPSKVLLWRYSGFLRRVATLIPIYLTGFRWVAIALRNPTDVHVLV
jgi:TPR repeat protein